MRDEKKTKRRSTSEVAKLRQRIANLQASETERKRLGEELRKSEQAFRSLFEASPVGLGLLVNRKIVKVNPALCKLTGYSKDELEGQSARIVYRDEEEFDRAGKILYEQVSQKGRGITEARLRFKSGAEIEGLMYLSPLDPRDPSAGFVASVLDITERTRTEEALKESESRFRNIIETSKDGIIFFDGKKRKIIFGNVAMAQLLGCSTEDLVGRSISSLHPPKEWASVEQEFQKHVSGELSISAGIPVLRNDGSVFYADISSSRITLEGQSYFSAFFRDITERKQAENLMHIQHELAVALSAAHELDEGLRLCVEAAIRVTGMDCGGVCLVDETSGALDLVYHRGLSPDFIKSVSQYDADSDHVRLVIAGKPVYNKHLNLGIHLDEAERQEGLLAIAIIPIHHKDRVIACLNIASHTVNEVPISARKALETVAAQIGSAIARLKSEEAFRKSKARFRGLVDLLPQTVFEIDTEGHFLFVNAFGLEFFGYTQDDIDKRLNVLQLVIPKDRRKVENNIRKVLNGEKLIGNEYTVMRKDGSTLPVILYSSPIIGEDKPVGLRGIVIDITERKRLIEERLDHLERLRRSLEETISALVSTLEAKDPYTAGHQKRVAELAVAIATEMGLSEEQVDGIRMAGLVHDIGKIYIPSDLLNKSNQLNEPEYELFKSHCQVGYDILKTIDFPWPVAPLVLQHHERLDGTGYPQGLYGRDIMVEARVLAVADVVEAMSSHRPYRPARGVGDALEEILHHKDSLYDPEVVDACLRVFYEKGFTFQEVEQKKRELEPVA